MTAFHRGGHRSEFHGHHMRNKGLLPSIPAPKLRSLVRGRKTQGQSSRMPSVYLLHGKRQPTAPPTAHLPACLAGGSRDGDCGPRLWWPGLGRLEVPCRHAAPDSWLASHQPWSSMDLNRPVPKSQLCYGAPCLGLPSHLHNILTIEKS